MMVDFRISTSNIYKLWLYKKWSKRWIGKDYILTKLVGQSVNTKLKKKKKKKSYSKQKCCNLQIGNNKVFRKSTIHNFLKLFTFRTSNHPKIHLIGKLYFSSSLTIIIVSHTNEETNSCLLIVESDTRESKK